MTLQALQHKASPATVQVRAAGREVRVEIVAPGGRVFEDGSRVHWLAWKQPFKLTELFDAAWVEHCVRLEEATE